MKSAGLVFLLAALLGVTGCGKPAMDSSWRTRQITVDGGDGDWQGAVTYVAKGSTVVSLLNDEEFLYLRLASADRSTQAQVMRLGFTVWFDARGGEAHSFGIRFPQGMGGRGQPFVEREGGREPGEGPPAVALGLPEIVGPGQGEHHRLTDPGPQGIALEVVQAEGRLVYELKIPLARDEVHPYGLGVRPGQQFSIGFETSTPGQEAMRTRRSGGGRRPGGMGGGGMGPEGMGGMEPPGMGMGGGGRGGRGMGGGRPAAGGELPQPLKLWVKVKLATGPGPEKRSE
jgi:hypothetical protein